MKNQHVRWSQPHLNPLQPPHSDVFSPVIRAVSLDLDDTLWPIEPVIVHAEGVLQAWMHAHYPHIASAWPLQAMRDLRQKTYDDNPHLWHDFSLLRRMSLATVFAEQHQSETVANHAYEIFFQARNQVTLYEDSLPLLNSLISKYPLASITNGNADLEQIGLAHFFKTQIYSRHVGVAKPHPQIFQHASEQLGIPATHIAHVGDHPEMDVLGAQQAGMRAVWLNRQGLAWNRSDCLPDMEINSLAQLPAALESMPAR